MPDGELDDAVRRHDSDRWLATRFIADPAARADVVALYAFDHQLSRAIRVASNSLIAEIRLTWWLDVIEDAFNGGSIRAHPVAQAFAAAILRHDLPREPLEAMVLARIRALDRPRLDAGQAVEWADGVGAAAAGLAARILDPRTPAEATGPAGRLWGLWRLAGLSMADEGELRRPILQILPIARREARRLSARAFPAVAQATLARAGLRAGEESGFVRRARLLWAVATGGL